MAKYRKRPVEVDAEQYLGEPTEGVCERCSMSSEPHIHTDAGAMNLKPGHWIITSAADGRKWPVDNDYFLDNYEALKARPREKTKKPKGAKRG